jgi:hypothetical protein
VIVYQLAQRGERYAPFLGESDKVLLIWMNLPAQDFSEAAAASCGALLVFFLNQSPQAFNPGFFDQIICTNSN